MLSIMYYIFVHVNLALRMVMIKHRVCDDKLYCSDNKYSTNIYDGSKMFSTLHRKSAFSERHHLDVNNNMLTINLNHLISANEELYFYSSNLENLCSSKNTS